MRRRWARAPALVGRHTKSFIVIERPQLNERRRDAVLAQLERQDANAAKSPGTLNELLGRHGSD